MKSQEYTYQNKMMLGLPVSNFGIPQSDEFIKNFNKTYEELRAKHPQSATLSPVQFEKLDVSQQANSLKWSDFLTKQNVIYFFSSGYIFSQTKNQNSKPYRLILQTLTEAFTFDLEAQYYQNGKEDDYLQIAARKQNEEFSKYKYENWKENLNPNHWNGIRYNRFYTNKLVDFYRGNIWIKGDEQTLQQIKEAWRKKDWRKFRSFGFLTGKQDANARWKLPEKLFKKHFNNPDNTFVNLASEQLNFPNLFRQDYARLLGSKLNDNFHIAFDDEASFAWTFSNEQNSHYYSGNQKERLEIFLVTDPLLYDVAIIKKEIDPIQSSLIAETFIELAKKGLDTFGPSVGYNGYRLIQDEDKEFFQKMSKTLEDE